MRKILNASFAYAIAAMAGGVFYREYTRLIGFEGQTNLAVVHTHLFALGMLFLLVAALAERVLGLTASRRFRAFWATYNTGVSITAVALFVRGLAQAGAFAASAGMNGALSGMAGIGHILTGVGLVLFFLMARECAGRAA